jgi:hypothetical protein
VSTVSTRHSRQSPSTAQGTPLRTCKLLTHTGTGVVAGAGTKIEQHHCSAGWSVHCSRRTCLCIQSKQIGVLPAISIMHHKEGVVVSAHAPVAGSQLDTQGLVVGSHFGVPTHTPLMHLSSTVHRSPSSHCLSTMTAVQLPATRRESVRTQACPSSLLAGLHRSEGANGSAQGG